MASVFQRFNQIKGVIVNNQKIIVKQGVISMNLLLKVQKEMKDGFNSLINRIANGVKSEISIYQEIIITKMGKRLSIVNISINEVRSCRGKCYIMGSTDCLMV
jgi:hypothetical protein